MAQHKRGFTIMELIAAIAVIVIIIGITMPLTSIITSDSRHKQLNNDAKAIYLAAQHRLSVLSTGSKLLDESPAAVEGRLNCVYVERGDSSLLIQQLMLDGYLQSGYYIIIYNKKNHIVTDVFTSAQPLTMTDFARYQNSVYRRENMIGWYGGDDIILP